ncbi:MAG TPA: hypothetical protein ENI13_00520 [candidate division CPR3 bacterium]|uniref:Portal protein n=1 Tax=candidate division CPR3 bacterium TaxID=2268181 RepID=A0A7C1NSA7_UNCC3|nr:hypothetical protein [candidate division CPR3 bacterium]
MPQNYETYELSSRDQRLITLLQGEKKAWEYGNVWVSDAAAFVMRNEIDRARKNYYGKFQEPVDPDTGLEKLFVPMTEWLVERMVTNTDIDTKHIQIRHPQGKSIKSPIVMKLIVANYLKRMQFGEFLNDFIRKLCIDGTATVKVFNMYSEEFKRNMPTLRVIDSLNAIIDPSAYSLQDVPYLERIQMTQPEIERMSGQWSNTDRISYSKGSVPEATIFERWGKIPLGLITKRDKDMRKWVEATVIASSNNVDSPFTVTNPSRRIGEIAVIHKVMLNPRNIKPYEEAWLRRVPNRYHGRGVPEQVADLQTWVNTVVNIRRDEMLKNLVGRYKILKGSGITKQLFEKMRTGGAIPVDNMDDVEIFDQPDVKGSAYREPAEVMQMAEKVTGAKELPTSDTMEPTTALIQEREARSTSALIQENIGLFLERLLRRQIIPMIVKDLKEGEIMRITGDPEDLDIIDESIVNHFVNKEVVKFRKSTGMSPSPMDVSRLQEKSMKKMKNLGEDRALHVKKYVFDANYDVDISVTAERLDPGVILRNLNDFLLTYTKLPQADLSVINSIVKEYLGMLDIPIVRKIDNAVAPPMPPEGQRDQRQPRQQQPNVQTEDTRANMEGVTSPAER